MHEWLQRKNSKLAMLKKITKYWRRKFAQPWIKNRIVPHLHALLDQSHYQCALFKIMIATAWDSILRFA